MVRVRVFGVVSLAHVGLMALLLLPSDGQSLPFFRVLSNYTLSVLTDGVSSDHKKIINENIPSKIAPPSSGQVESSSPPIEMILKRNSNNEPAAVRFWLGDNRSSRYNPDNASSSEPRSLTVRKESSFKATSKILSSESSSISVPEIPSLATTSQVITSRAETSPEILKYEKRSIITSKTISPPISSKQSLEREPSNKEKIAQTVLEKPRLLDIVVPPIENLEQSSNLIELPPAPKQNIPSQLKDIEHYLPGSRGRMYRPDDTRTVQRPPGSLKEKIVELQDGGSNQDEQVKNKERIENKTESTANRSEGIPPPPSPEIMLAAAKSLEPVLPPSIVSAPQKGPEDSSFPSAIPLKNERQLTWEFDWLDQKQRRLLYLPSLKLPASMLQGLQDQTVEIIFQVDASGKVVSASFANEQLKAYNWQIHSVLLEHTGQFRFAPVLSGAGSSPNDEWLNKGKLSFHFRPGRGVLSQTESSMSNSFNSLGNSFTAGNRSEESQITSLSKSTSTANSLNDHTNMGNRALQ